MVRHVPADAGCGALSLGRPAPPEPNGSDAVPALGVLAVGFGVASASVPNGTRVGAALPMAARFSREM